MGWTGDVQALIPSLRRAGYKANLVAAGESDARLETRLQQQQAAFSALSLDHAVAQMPRLQARAQLPGAFAALSQGAFTRPARQPDTTVCVGLWGFGCGI